MRRRGPSSSAIAFSWSSATVAGRAGRFAAFRPASVRLTVPGAGYSINPAEREAPSGFWKAPPSGLYPATTAT